MVRVGRGLTPPPEPRQEPSALPSPRLHPPVSFSLVLPSPWCEDPVGVAVGAPRHSGPLLPPGAALSGVLRRARTRSACYGGRRMDSKVSALTCCVHLGTYQALALPLSGWVSRHLGFLSRARFCVNHSYSFTCFLILLFFFFFFTVLLFLPPDQRLSSRKAGASSVLLADGIPGPSLRLTHVGAWKTLVSLAFETLTTRTVPTCPRLPPPHSSHQLWG